MLTHFIKLSYISYEQIIDKKINVLEYKKEFMHVFDYLNNKYNNLSYLLDEDNYTMTIYQEESDEKYNWLSPFYELFTISNPESDQKNNWIELCKLTLIKAETNIYK